jgi:hypothetical protein
MIPEDVSSSRPRKVRRLARLGTCQVCGKQYMVAETVDPPHIRPHGYDSYQSKRQGVRIQCDGSGQPPLEFDSTHTESTLRFCRATLPKLIERKEAIALGTAPPIGLTGVDALKVRFSGAAKIEADQRRRDVTLAQWHVAACQKQIDTLTRLLMTRATDPALTVQNLRHGLPRIGDLFRKNSDGRLYTVESTVPVPTIGRYGTSRPIRAPHYMCRRATDGTLHRFLQSTITRALNQQGGSLPPVGRPNE